MRAGMRAGLALAALLALPATAAASLALMLCTVDRCVAASDSRTWDTIADAAGGDTARKVDTRGAWAFFMTGHPSAWRAWELTAPHAGETAHAFGRRLLGAVPPAFEHRAFTFGVVRYGTPSDAYLAQVTVRPDATVDIAREAGPVPPFAAALGWDDGGADRDARLGQLQQALLTGPGEARMVALARDTLTAAAAQSPKVGGPQHVAVVDAGGARWLDAGARHWDGTNLIVVSAAVTIDANGIRIAPTSAWSAATAYGFTLPDATAGLSAWDTSGTYTLGALLQYTGTNTSQLLSTRLGSTFSASGGTPASALVDAASSSGSASVVLRTIVNGVDYAGQVLLGGVPEFAGATSGSAGSLAGYINVTVGGTAYRLPIYNP